MERRCVLLETRTATRAQERMKPNMATEEKESKVLDARKGKALDIALSNIEKQFGKGSVVRGQNSPLKKAARLDLLTHAIDEAVIQAHHLDRKSVV